MLALWMILSYLSGSLPWSVWLGRRFFQADPRQQPDGNPGTANAFRASGWHLGVPVLVLDFAKAFLPMLLAWWLLPVPERQLFWIACMPSLGHAFSLFLRFRGGRGIVVMFGVWAGLTLYAVPVVMGLTALATLLLFKRDELRTCAIPVVLIVYLLLSHAPGWMMLLAIVQLMIILAKMSVHHAQQSAPQRTGGA